MDQAQTLLEQAVVLAPQNFEVHFQLGRLLTQKKAIPGRHPGISTGAEYQ